MQNIMEGWSGFMTSQNAGNICAGMIDFLNRGPFEVVYASAERNFEPYIIKDMRFEGIEDAIMNFESIFGAGFLIKIGIHGFRFDALDKMGDARETAYFNFDGGKIHIRKRDNGFGITEFFIFRRQ